MDAIVIRGSRRVLRAIAAVALSVLLACPVACPAVAQAQGLPAGAVDITDKAARLLGKVTFDGSQSVTQGTSPWVISFGTPQAVTQSGTWKIGTVSTLTSITNAVAVTGTFWQATQPVSGTVATKTSLTIQAPTSATVGVASPCCSIRRLNIAG